MHTFPDDAAFAELRERRVDFIIVHGAFYPRDAYDRLIAQLDARRELRLFGTQRWERRETRVYQVLKARN
jgi:hypothetical protein